jgi:hypothetical protein
MQIIVDVIWRNECILVVTSKQLGSCLIIWSVFITNFMGHDLAIIIMQNFLFIGLYGINTYVIHLFVLFEHQCHANCLNTNVICFFILFRHGCYMSIHVVYTWKSCTWLPCLNNVWHSCLNNTNLWNNKFCTYLEQNHEAYKFVMLRNGWPLITMCMI